MKKIMREGTSGAVAGGFPTASSNESQSEHTPGPWELRSDSTSWVIEARSLALGKPYAYPVPLASRFHDPLVPMDASLANARMMAAAPESLTALKALTSVLRGMLAQLRDPETAAQHKSVDYVRGTIIQGDTAIAKAEGR